MRVSNPSDPISDGCYSFIKVTEATSLRNLYPQVVFMYICHFYCKFVYSDGY